MIKKNKRQPRNKGQEGQESVVPLKQMRDELGMTQAEFAVALGVDPSTISRCERGISEISLTVLQMKRFCQLTGKALTELPDYLGQSQEP